MSARRRTAAFLAASLVAGAASAQEAAPGAGVGDAVREEARGHFERGVRYIEAERWADAIAELQRARELRATAAVMFNLGLAYRAVGRNREAMTAFREYTRMSGATTNPELAARVEAYVRELAAGLGWIELQVDPAAARVRVDGEAPARPGPLEVDPGRHVIQVEAEGYASETRTVEVRRGAQATVVFHMVPQVLSSRVTVRAEPPSALVRIDGHDVGFGDVEETVRPGTHTLDVSAEGHRPFRRQFEALAGQSQTVRAVLSSNRSALASPWLWLGVGAVAVGAGVAAFLLLQDVEAPYRGTLGTVTDAVTVRPWP